MLTGVAIAAAVGLVTVPLWGSAVRPLRAREALHGRRRVLDAVRFPFFTLVDTKETVLVWLAIVLGVNVGHDLMYGPQAAYYSELFGTRVRYSGASLGYQLASVLSGGFAPLIAAALLAANDDEPTLVAIYMVVMGVITVVATAFARETYQRLPRGGPARGAAVLPRGRGRGRAPRAGRAGAARSVADCARTWPQSRRRAPRLSAPPSSRSRISRAASTIRSRYSARSLVGHVVAAPGERVARSPRRSSAGCAGRGRACRSCASASAASCVIARCAPARSRRARARARWRARGCAPGACGSRCARASAPSRRRR